MDPARSIMAQVLDDLSDTLMLQYQRFGSIGDLEEYILHRRHILDLEAPGIHRVAALDKLAKALVIRFELQSRLEDIQEATTHYCETLEFRKLGHPYRANSLNNLGNALFARFQRLGVTADLENAILRHREALEIHAPSQPSRFISLNNLANTLTTRFWHLGKTDDLIEVLKYRHEVLDLCGPGHPSRSSALANLASSLHTHFEQTKRIEELQESIMYGREALKLRILGESDYASSLSNLSTAIATRFKHLGREEDMQESIILRRDALKLCAPGHLHRSVCFNNLAVAIAARYERTGQIQDLEESIMFYREALQLDAPGHPGYIKLLNNLANSFRLRFEQLGERSDLEQVIMYHQKALDGSTHDDPNYASCLDNIANCAQTRFETSGEVEYLEQSVSYHRKALQIRVLGHPDRASSLNNLANALICRYELLGRFEDMEEMILYCQEALKSLPLDYPDRAGLLGNLAGALKARFQRFGRSQDREEAIQYEREALKFYPPGHLGRAKILGTLGDTLRVRFRTSGDICDLNEVVALHREALDFCPAGHPSRAAALNDLGTTLHDLFLRSHQTGDLEEAIAHKSAAVASLSDKDPRHAHMRCSLARTILVCPQLSGSDIATSFELFESAANQSTSNSLSRLGTALEWASAARTHEHESVVRAYSKALELLEQCLISRPTVELQQQFLASAASVPRSLASDAAASAISAGKLEVAVELLEQGRSILWSKMRGYRNPLEQLRYANGELAGRFEKVSAELEHLALSSEQGSMRLLSNPRVSLESQMQRHRILSEERNQLLESIRGVDGFSDFLRAVPFAKLRMAAEEGPVIIVNASKYRSDALILHAAGPPVIVPLPDVHPDDLASLSAELVSAQIPTAAQPAKRILPILRCLWEDVVCPVTDQLTELGVEEGGRIWWCPTSELCALPLHAAGPHTRAQKNLLDMYVSSYTPTVAALLRARSGLLRKLTSPRILVVGQPGDKTLPSVQEEISIIRRLGDFVDILVDTEADHSSVIEGLQQHSWAHFACHGHLDVQPFLSSFQLHSGGRLTLLSLMQAQLPNAEFAFLSACHSAAGDALGTPDETISLAAALQFCGFRSVVGTLFAMADIDGPSLAEAFYEYIFRKGVGVADVRDSAKALNLATIAMKQNGVPVHRWIKFVHIGA